ncbi:MAG: response regulator [Gemmatales bacterium]|nr:response regulator [Gemmatales bacterium]MCS7159264.1 response regulator [Gemmatales bacterium]MDW8174464.1 response regulator [Gemmatales bacterium]MDW8222182.1 response regulator [Gemmatales bacterium]
MPTRILLVEDEQSIVEVLRYNLEREGFEVQSCGDGREALRLAQLHTPDLIVLDLMLPNLDGLEVCRILRADAATARIPILMLTARSEEADQIVGLAVGADDYVTKPFSVKVVVQRIRALLRRAASEEVGQVLSAHGIRLDRRTHRVSVHDQPVHLTLTEFRFLEAFLRQPGRAFRRDELLEAAGTDADLVLERTVDVHIKSLRRKLGPAGEFIETVRGVGYRLREPGTAPEPAEAAAVSSPRRREKS